MELRLLRRQPVDDGRQVPRGRRTRPVRRAGRAVVKGAQLSLRPGVSDVADSAHFQKLGELAVVRGAEEPLARLQGHIRNTAQRVLLLAESDGRRESLLDFLRASSISPNQVFNDFILPLLP